jgi:hypothetical protein
LTSHSRLMPRRRCRLSNGSRGCARPQHGSRRGQGDQPCGVPAAGRAGGIVRSSDQAHWRLRSFGRTARRCRCGSGAIRLLGLTMRALGPSLSLAAPLIG